MLKHALKRIVHPLPKPITPEQAKDSGMVLALIVLLLASIAHKPRFLWLATALLLIDLIWPPAFRPFAAVWFGLSHLLGSVMSKIVFGLVFVVMVVPVGLVRRLMGKDPLLLKQWKRGRASVMKARNHGFTSVDVSYPY